MTTKMRQRQPTKKSTPKPHSSSSSSAHSDSQHRHEDPATSNRPQTSIREASIADVFAHASYTPVMDNDADPNEVIWTWVPYQEDSLVGKDRPTVVIGTQDEGVYLLQLTSEDHTHDAPQETAAGRYWFDIGAGDWGSKGRPSEVRLDRALWIKATDVRREGSILPKAAWQLIIDALKEYYHAHGDWHLRHVTDLTRDENAPGYDEKAPPWYDRSLDSWSDRAGGLVRTVCGCPHA